MRKPCMRFTGEQHLRETRVFLEMRESAAVCDCGMFIIRLRLREDCTFEHTRPRLGVIASRRIGNAVHRNRAKRLLREVFRLNQTHLPATADVLLIARKHLVQQDFETLQARYIKGVERCLKKQ